MKIARALALGIACSCIGAGCWPQVDRDYSGSKSGSEMPLELRVDINHATLEQLLMVPGLKRTWAARIVRFRPYRTKQDLLDQGVVPGDVYSRIRDYVIAHHAKQ